MRILVSCVFFGLLFSIGPAWGQPMYYDELKKGEELAPKQGPPLFLRAMAAEVKGEVVVWLSRPTRRSTVKKAGPNDPKVFTGTVLVWAADKRPSGAQV